MFVYFGTGRSGVVPRGAKQPVLKTGVFWPGSKPGLAIVERALRRFALNTLSSLNLHLNSCSIFVYVNRVSLLLLFRRKWEALKLVFSPFDFSICCSVCLGTFLE